MPRILLASIAPWKQILLCDSSLVSLGYITFASTSRVGFWGSCSEKKPFVPDLFPTCSSSRTWGISDILHNMSYAHRCPGATTYRSAFEDCGWWDTDQRISKRFFGADLSLLLMLRKLMEILRTTWDAVSNPKTDVFHIKIVKDQLVQDFDISSINECWWKVYRCTFQSCWMMKVGYSRYSPSPTQQSNNVRRARAKLKMLFPQFSLESFN